MPLAPSRSIRSAAGRGPGIRVLALAVTGALLTACAGSDEQATPAAEQAADPALFPFSVLESELYEQLTPEQQAQVNRYRDMDLREFERELPEAERMAYAQFVYDVYSPGAIEQLEEPKGGEVVPASPVSEQNDGQEILDHAALTYATMFWVLSDGGRDDAVNEQNRLDAQKMAALYYHLELVETYDETVQQLATITDVVGPGIGVPGLGYPPATAVAESRLVSNPSGMPTKYVHARADGALTQRTMEFRPFVDLRGEPRARWVVRAISQPGGGTWFDEEHLLDLE